MELKIVRDGTFRPAVLGGVRGGNVHEDILVIGGRDSEVQWEDIYHGMLRSYGIVWGLGLDEIWLTSLLPDLGDDLREPPAFHDEMEKRLKMDF
ncbi:unnamed protein product [Penicillium nalgiovense]|nr:unnamed protein product [Penicillium nalgiovense]